MSQERRSRTQKAICIVYRNHDTKKGLHESKSEAINANAKSLSSSRKEGTLSTVDRKWKKKDDISFLDDRCFAHQSKHTQNTTQGSDTTFASTGSWHKQT